ncbi:unnamed protein product [Cylicocyclus nassatus]|uniref:Invertebrate defensins family profile domain-containing protein n=1 Tax=Cylicocyclus nassatus TaxID=53992 RepID=A0AA36DMS5_CYLNA|nr:unnamed protein product [Cylicocyclus nassatus]
MKIMKFMFFLTVLLCMVASGEGLSCQLGGNAACSVSCWIQGRHYGGYCNSRGVCICNR